MKLNLKSQWAKAVLTASLIATTLTTIGCVNAFSKATGGASPVAQSSMSGTETSSGSFVAKEHPTTGKVKIVKDKGKTYLEFDKTFSSDSGPDLYVILHRAKTPQTYKQADYVIVDRLQNTSGAQRYEIPNTVDPTQYKSVVIWCRQFNATFGYATIKS